MRRMLIVDDEDTIRWALRELFAQDGWDVHAAADGEEALRKILECTYDFMITDLKMPGRHGVEVIGEARRLNPRMGVAVLTGYASVETAIDALRMRAWDYLTKPFDMRYLKQSIEGYFREMAARDGQGPDEVLDVKGERPADQPLHQNSKFEFVGKFAGGVAHDFNNLLTGIAGYAELARAASPEGSTVRRDLNQILDLAQRAEELTRQLQAFSRSGPMEPVEVDLKSLIEKAAKMLHRLIGEDIELRLQTPEGVGTVYGDPAQLEQVLMTLVVNARDAMPRGGRLTIQTADLTLDGESARELDLAPGDYAVLSVSDTGCGMDRQKLGRMFEPFLALRDTGKGTGLGMAAVSGIVRRHGGALTADSRCGGATFSACLPRCRAPAAGAPADDESQAAGSPDGAGRQGAETVLVVEDDPWVRRLMERVLAMRGYTVLAVQNAAEARRAVREGPARALHLLIADIVLPGGDGVRLSEELRRLRPGLKVLYVSGYGEDVIARCGEQPHAAGAPAETLFAVRRTVRRMPSGPHGAAPLLRKPFTARMLTRRVREVLEGPCPADAGLSADA